MASRPKRALVVTLEYPPLRSSAVYRMTGLTKYLVDHGWHSTVLAAEIQGDILEPKLLEKVPPEVRIVRTRFPRINSWEDSAATLAKSAGALRAPQPEREPSRLDKALRSLGELARSTLYYPDVTSGWIPHALRRAIRLHRENPFDVIFTTTPPRAAPVVGLLFKQFYDIPWVMELMDPWYPHSRPIRRRTDDWLYRRILNNSDRVVVMVEEHAENLTQDYGVPAEKLAVVRNGFFEDDFREIERAPRNHFEHGLLHFAHFGNTYPEASGTFFPALAEILKEEPALRERVRIHLVGFPIDKTVLQYSRGELSDITTIHGYLEDRFDVLKMMRSSGILLLFWGRPRMARLSVAGKTYDYLRTGRPIFAVTQQGGVKKLVEQGNIGWVADPNDFAAMKTKIRSAIGQYLDGNPPGPAPADWVAQFRWDRHAATLARVFEEAVDARR